MNICNLWKEQLISDMVKFQLWLKIVGVQIYGRGLEMWMWSILFNFLISILPFWNLLPLVIDFNLSNKWL